MRQTPLIRAELLTTKARMGQTPLTRAELLTRAPSAANSRAERR